MITYDEPTERIPYHTQKAIAIQAGAVYVPCVVSFLRFSRSIGDAWDRISVLRRTAPHLFARPRKSRGQNC